MKCLRARYVAPSLLLVGAALSSSLAWSMSEMNDNQLSTTTGQDGITVLISPPAITTGDQAGYTVNGETQAALTQTNGLKIGAAILHDKDGFTGYTSGGALIFGDARQANSSNTVGVQMGIYGSSPISVVMDASSGKATTGLGGASPVLNINIGLPSDLLIRTGDVSLDVSNRTGIATGASGATAANATVGGTAGYASQILQSMDIALNNTSLNLQLGNTPQGGMLVLSSFNISPSFTLGLVSPNAVSGLGATSCSTSLAAPNCASSLTTNVVITNLNLSGATIDAVQDMGLALGGSSTGVGGLILSDASFSVGSLQLNSATAGTVGNVESLSTSPAYFGGTANASMGSFGMTGLSVTGLKVGVSGM